VCAERKTAAPPSRARLEVEVVRQLRQLVAQLLVLALRPQRALGRPRQLLVRLVLHHRRRPQHRVALLELRPGRRLQLRQLA
jgi:hypothetical protein